MASWFEGWWGETADLGPYIGPWPPTTPPDSAMTLAAANGADEIDYLICLPNPSDPTSPADGTYSTYARDEYTYVNNDGSFGTGLYLRASTVGVADAFVPGMHIYVLWYWDNGDGAPSIAPESLAPASFTALGTGGAARPYSAASNGWTNSDSVAGWPYNWLADMGLYTGPWPMQPPPIGADELIGLFFIVAVPNSDEPGLSGVLQPGQIYYLLGADGFWNVVDAPVYTASIGKPDPKSHLYVATNGLVDPLNFDHVPLHPPSYYVPRGYADSGNCPVEQSPGEWVELPGYLIPGTGANNDSLGGASEFLATRDYQVFNGAMGGDPPAQIDSLPFVDECVADIQGQVAADVIMHDVPAPSISYLRVHKDGSQTFSVYHVDEKVEVVLGQVAEMYDWTGSFYGTPVLPRQPPPNLPFSPIGLPTNVDLRISPWYQYNYVYDTGSFLQSHVQWQFEAPFKASFQFWDDFVLSPIYFRSGESQTYRYIDSFGSPDKIYEEPTFERDITRTFLVHYTLNILDLPFNPFGSHSIPPAARYWDITSSDFIQIGTITATTNFAAGTVDFVSDITLPPALAYEPHFALVTTDAAFVTGHLDAWEEYPITPSEFNASSILAAGTVHEYWTGMDAEAFYLPNSKFMTPNYKYWVQGPNVPSFGHAIPLRLIQRDDGIGPISHARLNNASSELTPTAPRMGSVNVYP